MQAVSKSAMSVSSSRPASELPKPVWVQHRGKALFRCWVHLLPIAAIVVVTVLNIKGFFIGEIYPGDSSSSMQNLNVLGLQIAAKLLELLIGSSLGLTILDIIRVALTQSDDGLPLGMVGAGKNFTDIKYFFSSKFWGGVRGLSQPWQRWLIATWLLICGIVFALAGPATAVLVLPSIRPTWPAGAAFFHAAGNRSFLFPTVLDSNAIGGPLCRSPSSSDVSTPSAAHLGCPWAGYTTLLAAYTQWGSDLMVYPGNSISLFEWQQPREIFQRIRAPGNSPESWATGTRPAVNIWSGSLDLAWRGAVQQVGLQSAAANFKYGSDKTTHIATMLPAVRTVCHYQNVSRHDAMNLSFPLLEPFRTWSGELFVLPKENLTNMTSSTDTAIQWIPKPTTRVPTSNGELVEPFGSAFSLTKVPSGPNGIPASVMTCSIDARWAPGESVSKGPIVPVLDPAHLRNPSGQQPLYNEGAGFLPKDDGSWQTISIHQDWLHSLAPAIDDGSGERTTLTNLFKVIGLINGTHDIPNIDIVYAVAANAISTLVTDAISRIGIQYQAGNPTISACYIDPKDYSSFFTGDQASPSYTYPPPVGVHTTNQTQIRWYVTLSGLSYKADSSATQLSLSLLLLYTAMALAHTVWAISTGYSSEAWSDPTELVVLAMMSPPTRGSLENTCAGVEKIETWTKHVAIRAVSKHKQRRNREELHIAIAGPRHQFDRHNKVERNVDYGYYE